MGGTIRSKTPFAGAKRVAVATARLAAGASRGFSAKGRIIGAAENSGGLTNGATSGYATSGVAVREALAGAGEKDRQTRTTTDYVQNTVFRDIHADRCSCTEGFRFGSCRVGCANTSEDSVASRSGRGWLQYHSR
jgi:hypothetical protein